MTLPLISAVGGISLNAAAPATPTASASASAQSAGALAGEGLRGAEQLGGGQALGAAGAQAPSAGAGVQEVQGTAGSEASGGGEGPSEQGSGGFGSALTEAISSLEGTQHTADSAAQALATGTVKEPESAVVKVEDAALAMQLAAQLRTKATEAVQTIFQTQV